LRPRRRLRFQPSGVVVLVGVLSLGLATLNTGNNLLYLLVGALLGLILASGWASERTLTGLRIARRVPFGVTAGQPARIEYQVSNRKRRLPSGSLELRDTGLSQHGRQVRIEVVEPAFLPLVPAGQHALGAEVITVPRRGVYRFEELALGTTYPFGMFVKQRTVRLPGTLVVWPRTDRPVPAVRALGGRRVGHQLAAGRHAPGAERGDYRGLRSYRAGDDPRDIHWRTTARRGAPIVREYDRDPGDTYWIVLDTGAAEPAGGEVAVELAASLAAAASARGDRFGFAAGAISLPPPAGGGSQLEAVLDLLARVELRTGEPLQLPAHPAECVLVTAGSAPERSYAVVVRAGPEA
jgi:uncharacterized protein (DUF58 family)